MAKFAFIDENNKVQFVKEIKDSEILSSEGNVDYELGKKLLSDAHKNNLEDWITIQYDENIGINMTYDQERKRFLKQKPFESWILNEISLEWESPIPPVDGFNWNEETKQWDIPAP